MEKIICLSLAAALVLGPDAACEPLKYKDKLPKHLVDEAAPILRSQDPRTGRFGTGVWICTDQNAIYPLAGRGRSNRKRTPTTTIRTSSRPSLREVTP